jgi:ribonuclease VapC
VIVVDTSALVAVVTGETAGERCVEILGSAQAISVSAVSLVEAGIVLESRHGPTVAGELDLLIQALQIMVVPVDAAQAAIARQAYRLYGKGRHPAALNFGDCFSYALARLSVAPLLFVGNDFNQTDIEAA